MAFPHTTRDPDIWAERFKMNVKIEQELNFVIDDSQLFLDAQEAKKMNLAVSR